VCQVKKRARSLSTGEVAGVILVQALGQRFTKPFKVSGEPLVGFVYTSDGSREALKRKPIAPKPPIVVTPPIQSVVNC
jgi:hypothetical protein